MVKVLVTGFEPFDNEQLNPSLEIIKQLPKQIDTATIVTATIPTVFHESATVLQAALQKHQPDAVLCIGQAGGRAELCMERVAINQDDARIPDNACNQPIDEEIRSDGAAAYFSTLPIKAIVAAIQQIGIPARISNTAGTFVCNHLMYQSLYFIEKEFNHMSAGFMHIPCLPEQVATKTGVPSMSLEDMIKGVTVAIKTIISYQHQPDLKSIGGEIQ